MLVHPVRGQPRDNPLAPPGGSLHFLLPAQRGVPVVADVVVVEDHGAGQGGQQPPVRRVRPRQKVEVGVLLIVLKLLAGRFGDVPTCTDELLHLLAGQIGVHLVPEEGDKIRPREATAGGHPERVGTQRVDAVGPVTGLIVRDTRAAGAEGHPQRPAGLQRGDHWRREPGRWVRPDVGSVDLKGVGRDRSRFQSVHFYQRVVMAVHRECVRLPVLAVSLDRNPRGSPGLHPDTGRGLIHEPHHGAERQG